MINNARQSAGKTMKLISDEYLIGFIEGEGCFYASIVPSKETTFGWQVIHFFKVSQNPCGKNVLLKLQQRLGCGYLKQNAGSLSKDKSLAFVVRNIRDLQDKVVPFLEGKLIIKNEVFSKFKSILDLVHAKKHLTKKGVEQVIELAYSMNTKKRRYKKEKILKSFS